MSSSDVTSFARPRLAGRIQGLPPSLYARIFSRLAAFEGEVSPFHIGETHLLPSPAIMDSLRAVEEPAVHHYAHPQGHPELREAIADHVLAHGWPSIDRDDVLVTHGATHALNLACQAILDPGDVMLVLSPHWPLINAMVHTACAVPLEVPFFCSLRSSSSSSSSGAQAAYDRLAAHWQPRVRAIYVTSPNNPDGCVLTDDELQGIARFCVERDVYALVDDAYERFHFGSPSPRLAGYPGMQDRTIGVFTFSKSYRMAGLRVGYAVAPTDVRSAMVKLANISVYNVSMLTQRAALKALVECEDSVTETVAAAERAARWFADTLQTQAGVAFVRPEGGAYVFANLDELLGERDCFDLLERCLDEGVVFAPGTGFGAAYLRHARFCFTAMDEQHLRRGTERLMTALSDFADA